MTGSVRNVSAKKRYCAPIVALVDWYHTVSQERFGPKEVQYSHATLGLQHQSLGSTHMRNSISHPKNDFEGIRSHNPPELLCLSTTPTCTREIALLTGSSSHEELNWPGTFWRKNCNP